MIVGGEGRRDEGGGGGGGGGGGYIDFTAIFINFNHLGEEKFQTCYFSILEFNTRI